MAAVKRIEMVPGYLWSGQLRSHGTDGHLISCEGSGQDAEFQLSQFAQIRESYWSSTTSMFEPDWAWALYLEKGAVGVGQKSGRHFHVWPVCDRA